MATASTYTDAFDGTFRFDRNTSPARLGHFDVVACPDDFRLQWLTPTGWCSWTFEAPSEEGMDVTPEGTYLSDQLLRDTRRQSDYTLLLRTANLDAATRRVLKTVFNSAAVFLVTTDPATGVLSTTPVRVTPGSFVVNRSRVPFEGISVQLTLPVRHSFRTL